MYSGAPSSSSHGDSWYHDNLAYDVARSAMDRDKREVIDQRESGAFPPGASTYTFCPKPPVFHEMNSFGRKLGLDSPDIFSSRLDQCNSCYDNCPKGMCSRVVFSPERSHENQSHPRADMMDEGSHRSAFESPSSHILRAMTPDSSPFRMASLDTSLHAPDFLTPESSSVRGLHILQQQQPVTPPNLSVDIKSRAMASSSWRPGAGTDRLSYRDSSRAMYRPMHAVIEQELLRSFGETSLPKKQQKELPPTSYPPQEYPGLSAAPPSCTTSSLAPGSTSATTSDGTSPFSQMSFSDNYRGERTLRNCSAVIDDSVNCSLWITNLPPAVSHNELLSEIRGIGRVYATVINPPNASSGHSTSAAKIVFFERNAAHAFFVKANHAGFVLRGFQARVSWNRIKSSEQANSRSKSRVLVLTGFSEVVNEEFLMQWFSQRFKFEVDKVVPIIDTGVWAKLEFRFGSYRCQAEAAKMAIAREFKASGVMTAPRGSEDENKSVIETDQAGVPRGSTVTQEMLDAIRGI
ncbi:hypothetical protein Cpir12675_002551 [Ceratocystis pirilliformis]|uniref:Uncharacterized protein n=1 Tax=Ceratocystis pirilliformis TaxID=259994 RepID=A0ABR3Z8J5_9PEZI